MVVRHKVKTFFYPPGQNQKPNLGIFCVSMSICGREASFFSDSAGQGGFLLPLYFMQDNT